MVTAGVANNVFNLACPSSSRASCDIQYDGIDNSSDLSLFPGLGGIDLTQNKALGFRISATSDISTSFVITVYSGNGTSISVGSTIIGDPQITSDYLIPFDSFSGIIDFSNIFAIVLNIEGNENVDVYIKEFVVYGLTPNGVGSSISASILPCDTYYYRIQTLSNLKPGDYVKITFDQTVELESLGVFYVVSSDYSDLQSELATNVNIVDTLGDLPGPNNYIYKCNTSHCDIEITSCQLEETTYYLAVTGNDVEELFFTVEISLQRTPVYQLFGQIPQPIFLDKRPPSPSDRTLYYRYFAIDIPETMYSEGTYLVVNISKVASFSPLEMRLNFGGLPESPFNTGVIGSVDFDSNGDRVDDCTFQYCVNTTRALNGTYFENPVNIFTQQRIPCITTISSPFQNTNNLTVDPCHFQYGKWYISVLLPPDSNDTIDTANYTLTAYIIQPQVTALFRNATTKGSVFPELTTHYKISVPASDIVQGESHLIVQIANIRNGYVVLWVHHGMGGNNNLVGPEGCVPANATCRTRDSCNIIIEKCNFVPGTWYISVSISYNTTSEAFDILEPDRLPITFTIRATWEEDSKPTPLYAGIPAVSSIGEALYDFYVLDVPPTVDTWLYIELYSRCEDTNVILSVRHGSIPGGNCYASPDFYCLTGSSNSIGNLTRQSCTFMIQTCDLEYGPLYFSVYGHHSNYPLYGNTTYYQIPVQYTLYVDFDTATAIRSNISYSDSVVGSQYQHYYIRAVRVNQGSYMSVEVTNIQHGGPQSVEVFVNYNYLAGDCPCYDHLYNCSGINSISDGNVTLDVNKTCCNILVPPSDFRSGVWYISVLGVDQDFTQYTTPIGYTLTATIYDAPKFLPLFLGQEETATVPRYNKSLQYTQFKVAAVPIPLHDLVINLVYLQSCDFLGGHNNHNDTLVMYVKADIPASELTYDYICEVNEQSESYCTVVVPHCDWNSNDYFISVKGNYNANSSARFTLRANLQEVRDFQLTSGVSIYNVVTTGTYKHFFIESDGIKNKHLLINLYTNQDQGAVSMYLNINSRAGTAPCFTNTQSCIQQKMCSWQINAIDLVQGRYYISIFGERQWYDTSAEFTLSAEFQQFATELDSTLPYISHILVDQVLHYRYSVDRISFGDYLTISIENVDYGSVLVYVNYEYAAGKCPGYLNTQSCSASSEGIEWCEVRIPSCELQLGDYYITVVGKENFSPCEDLLQKIGYIIEVTQTTPYLITAEVDIGRDISNSMNLQFLSDSSYAHYQFQYTNDDYLNGYQIMVEITNVVTGSLFVYYNKGSVSDTDVNCQLAQICTDGLSSGGSCFWQIPFSLSKPTNVNEDNIEFQYITVEAVTGRYQVAYSILIWKEAPPASFNSRSFTLDGVTNSLAFPPHTEVNVVHYSEVQPNGGVQFIKLLDVPAHTDGEMLEVFFYRIINNIGELMSFNVYLYPETQAGAHECCLDDSSTLGSCIGAPTLRNVETTTQTLVGIESISHLCDLPVGTGGDPDGANPFFGERCTVRVWPCTYSRYCENATNWWLTVVPTQPTSGTPSAPLPGLSYSVQWRVRNIKLNEQLQVDSVSLNSLINTYSFSDAIPIQSQNTEDEGWESFYIDVIPSHSRISIQTNFINGTSAVYIQPEHFASPPFDTCNSYYCISNDPNSTCDTTGRFISNECNSNKYSRYYITVRNLSGRNTVSLVSFRIIKVDQPPTIHIPPHLTAESPFISSSSTGIEGENYDTFVLPLDDSDFNDHQYLLIDVTRPIEDDEGSLVLYVRYGSQAGEYGGNSHSFYPNPETCYSWLYSCDLPFAGSRCTLQIPHTELIQGFWYISLYNPNFQFDGINENLPDYSMVVELQDKPMEISLGIPHISNNFLPFPGTFINYRLNLTAHQIGLFAPRIDDNEIYGGDYYTSFLRFILEDFTGDIKMYINYDDLAGEPTASYNPFGYYQQSLSFISAVNCTNSTDCFIDFTPCERDQNSSFKLKSGIYYISLMPTVETSINLTAYVLTDTYTVLQPEEIVGTDHRAGTNNMFWSHTVSSDELVNQGDGEFYYRYTLNTTDNLPEKTYFIVNFTMQERFKEGNNTLTLDVWRDDCTRFSCNLPLNGGSWCVIDAVTLAPCSAKGGRFYFKVYNPDTIPFTLSFYQNQTVIQTLLDEQIITEVIYPYEYQEYFFEAVDVNEGATLTVEICAECGEVESWIRPLLPAGPNCGIGHCSVTASENESCCTMFLDTCQYPQQAYYIAVRGVSTEFPSIVNPNLYLPARYQIQANQTNIDILNIAFVCPVLVTYLEPQIPQQFAVDLETANIGALLRFTLILPAAWLSIQNDTEFATLTISQNRTVGYTTACTNLQYSCSIPFDQESLMCEVMIPAYDVSPGRYYIWANAPQGSEVIVERWDPYIPIVQPNLLYSATINSNNILETNSTFTEIFMPAIQYFRFDLEFDDDEFDNYDETFFLRVLILNVAHGSISATLNSGNFPLSELHPSMTQSVFFNNISCSLATDGQNCYIDLSFCDLFDNRTFSSNINTIWITVYGQQQIAELHAIQYSIAVQTNWIFTYYPVNHTICNTVQQGDYNFHRLRPHAQEVPQHSILQIQFSEVDANNGDEIAFFLQDGSIPSIGCFDLALRSGVPTEEGDNINLGTINVDWICPYQNLYLSVYGISNGPIDYRMNVTNVPFKVKELFNDQVYHHDDDDNDACGSTEEKYDFYIFNVSQNTFHTAFLRVAIESELPFTVYLNKGGFAYEECHIAKGSTTSGTVNLYDFCHFDTASYFITVVADGPYSIYTNVRDDAKSLTLGEVFRDTLEHGQYQIYTLDICKDWFAPDDRLVIEIADVQNGGVYGLIQLNSNPGPFQSPAGNGVCAISGNDAFAQYGPGNSGVDFLLIDHSQLVGGTYHILIRAQPNSNDTTKEITSTNPQFVSFRLFPHLEDLEIDPIDLPLNSLTVSQAVDFYTLDRNVEANPPRTMYYKITFVRDFNDTTSFAQIRLQNVRGGLLNLRVSIGHLSTPPSAYITGKTQFLTRQYILPGNIQSGRRPFTYQHIMDDRNSSLNLECDGSADFCAKMHFDKNHNYGATSSVAVWTPSCAFDLETELFVSVEAIDQFYEDEPITYELSVDQIPDYVFLPPDTGFNNSMTEDNWEYHFYRSIQPDVVSARWRVVVSNGEGVLVTVRNNRCPLQATWTREIWCDANYFGQLMCDIEIPTEAAHPGNNAFFISVFGKNVTYTIAYWRGLENCHLFKQNGYPEGLNFCAGIVDYPTWRWDDYTSLDNEANCFFNELYDHFKSQPCWYGVTTDCNSTLRQFACYESFKACDANGFYVGTCRSSCDAVVYQCVNWFETVNLEAYNCSSSRYINDKSSYCTGSGAYSKFNENTQLFFGNNPYDILYNPYL